MVDLADPLCIRSNVCDGKIIVPDIGVSNYCYSMPGTMDFKTSLSKIRIFLCPV